MKQLKVLFVWCTHKGILSKITDRTVTFSRSTEVLRCCLDGHRKGFITIPRTHPSCTPLTLHHLPAHVKGFILIAKNWTKFCAGSFGPLVVTVCWRFWLKASGYHGSTSIMAIPQRPPPPKYRRKNYIFIPNCRKHTFCPAHRSRVLNKPNCKWIISDIKSVW